MTIEEINERLAQVEDRLWFLNMADNPSSRERCAIEDLEAERNNLVMLKRRLENADK